MYKITMMFISNGFMYPITAYYVVISQIDLNCLV